MVRKTLIAGNWKMNCLLEDGVALAKGVAQEAKKAARKDCEFLICPPFTLLASAKKAIKGSRVMLGAQDCHFVASGAHTGDISPVMLKDLGCQYVIVGHSERRTDHYESDELVRKKAEAAINAGLKVIICIGETEAERDAGHAIDVCTSQINGSVPDVSTAQNTVIAYEPVWAIGTGRTPTTDDVEEVHAAIRKAVSKKLGRANANKMRILYGGSMKPANAKALLALPDVDGGLIGGASLKVADFMAIAEASKQKSIKEIKMGSVLLVIHLMVAILLGVLILMQRNSGNALSGLGGGNGADSFLSARGKGNLLTRTTAVLATVFFITSILLSLYYKGETRKPESITDVAPLVQTEPAVPSVPDAAAQNQSTAPAASDTAQNPAPAPASAAAPETPSVPAAE